MKLLKYFIIYFLLTINFGCVSRFHVYHEKVKIENLKLKYSANKDTINLSFDINIQAKAIKKKSLVVITPHLIQGMDTITFRTFSKCGEKCLECAAPIVFNENSLLEYNDSNNCHLFINNKGKLVVWLNYYKNRNVPYTIYQEKVVKLLNQ